jgi:hypothetical protein
MKSITTSATGKILIDVPALRAELVANEWKLGALCIAAGHSAERVRATLREGKRGQALLAEYKAKRPKNAIQRGPRVELTPTHRELERLRDAAGDEPLGPWILRRALEAV